MEALPLPLIDSLGSAFRALSKVVQERRTRHASLNQLNGLRSYFEKLKQNLKALFEFDLVSAAAYSHLTVQAFEFVDKFADAVKVSEAREQEIIAVVFKHWLGDPLVLKGAEGEHPVNCWRIRMSYNETVSIHVRTITDIALNEEDPSIEGVMLVSPCSSMHTIFYLSFTLSNDELTLDVTNRLLSRFYIKTKN